MIATIFWKEWREQRAIALAVLCFGAGALALTALFVDPSNAGGFLDRGGPRQLMAQGLAYLAGSVCGAMLLADEKEVGTLEFLDTLPCPRRTLWFGKAVFGVVMTLSQCLVLGGLAWAFNCIGTNISPAIFIGFLVAVGWLAFAWGMFGGALARSTLGAVFQGSIGTFVAGLLLSIPAVLLSDPRTFGRGLGRGMLLFYSAWVGIGLLASLYFFTSLDRDRHMSPRVVSRGIRGTRGSTRASTPRAMLWLTARQAVLVSAAALASGAIVGIVMLSGDLEPWLLWPAITLSLGVLAGVTAFAEEQTRGIARFWAERRLPLGRFWLMKVSFHLLIAAGAALLVFLPLLLTNSSSPFRTRIFAREYLGAELGRFLWLGLIYGFVVGHLAGLLFHKTMVAGLAATVVAATFAGMLFPAVISGGARSWQIWGPAIILLLTSRWLMYPWATDRITATGPVWRTITGVAGATLLFGAGIAYRVYEIPDVPDRLVESGYPQSIPSYDDNDGGREALSATARFQRASQEAAPLYPRTLIPGATSPSRTTPNNEVIAPSSLERMRLADTRDPLERFALLPWSVETEVLKKWLDQVFEEKDWIGYLREVPNKTVGIYQDPRDNDHFTSNEAFRNLRQMILAIRLRGNQGIHEGRPQEYLTLLPGALAVIRTARFKSDLRSSTEAMECEEVLLDGLRLWLAQTPGKPEELQLLARELQRHEMEMATNFEEVIWAEQILLRNSLDRVGAWVPQVLDGGSLLEGLASTPAEAEGNLVAFAWNVPWERIRRERLTRVLTQPNASVNLNQLSKLHLPIHWQQPRADRFAAAQKRALAWRRIASTLVALRHYELDRGEMPTSLQELVPRYLARLPEDPYSGMTLGYRRSLGELLTGNAPGQRDPALLRYYLISAIAGGVAPPSRGSNAFWLLHHEVSVVSPAIMPMLPAEGPSRSPNPASGFVMGIRPGAGVLWSVGPDGKDNAGLRAAQPGMAASTGQDWVIVLPPIRWHERN